MDPIMQFYTQVQENIKGLSQDRDVQACSHTWLQQTLKHQYSYNYSWMDRPIIQYPQDIVAMQELIWRVRPDLIIETGIAHGGSLVMNASMLAMMDVVDAIESGTMIDPKKSTRLVLGVDIDIRRHNRAAIESHPMFSRIQMLEGSSVEPSVVAQVKEISSHYKRVLVCLDSNHTHDHVLAELQEYASLTSIGSYCVVFDTIIEDLPADVFLDRPWGPGNNPKTAVWEYLKNHSEFEIDKDIQHKLLITVAPDGYLKRIS